LNFSSQTTAAVDVIIAGAGAAGLSAAIALADAGFETICIGSLDNKANGRTVALFEGSLRFYRSLKLWDDFSRFACPIEQIAMIDDTGSIFDAGPVQFAAREIGLPAFGANIENDRLVERLLETARQRSRLRLHESLISDVVYEADKVTVKTDDGRTFEARLIVAADGRKSICRQKASIGARSWTYPQSALTVLLAHEKPHKQTSVEFHTRVGPCTLVPLPATPQAPHRSSLVWLMTAADLTRRAKLSEAALAAEITRQTRAPFGAMTLDGPPGFFPMAGLKVSRLAGHRIALIGEAAHVFPPLAAQGLNLSLRDTASLVETLEDARAREADIGLATSLAPFAKERRSDISVRTHGVDILNRSLLSDLIPVDFLRGAGLLAFSKIGPLRRAIMREGVLPYGHVPRLMQTKTSVSQR